MRRFIGMLAALVVLGPLTTAVPAVVAAAEVAPAAAPGAPAVTVQTYGGGTVTTTSIQVQLLLSWPAGADQAAVTNGDGTTQTFAVADVLDWQLLSPTKAPADTRTVTVTYTGPGLAPAAASDSILLDVRPPRLPVQRLFQNGKGWFLATEVEDRGAGVRGIALLGSTGAPITGTDVCSLALCPPIADVPFFLRTARPRVARLTDAAGNVKAVQLVRRATRCDLAEGEYPVFTMADRFYDCVQQGDRCRPDDGHFWNRSAYVRCRTVAGKRRVVLR